jgi:hypothetical protein
MISIWAFLVACVVFGGILIWERWDYSKLQENCMILEHFLDMYISKHGPLPGIGVESEEEIDANNTKE